MTLQELTSHLQSLCHEGHSQDNVMIENIYERYWMEHVKFYVDKTDDGTPFVVIREENLCL